MLNWCIGAALMLFFLFSGPKVYGDFTADIIFLMDSSVDVDQNTFNREKSFVKSMVRSLNLSPDKSRVAVISYGNTPVEVVRFSSSQGIAAITIDLDNARKVAGRRNIAKALKLAASVLDGSRPAVSRVIVFLTGGSELYLTTPSQALKDHGTDRYVIALGPDADEEELTPIIDEPRDMFTIATPQELTWRSEYMVDEIFKRTGEVIWHKGCVGFVFFEVNHFSHSIFRVNKLNLVSPKYIIIIVFAFVRLRQNAIISQHVGFLCFKKQK